MLALAGFVWLALAVQFVLMVENSLGSPLTLSQRVVNFFTYFTVLTNLAIALHCTVLAGSPASALARRIGAESFQTGLAVNIALVGITYELLLRGFWKPQGWHWLADTALHDAVPLMFLLYWLFIVPKGSLRVVDIPKWMIYPAAYFLYIFCVGPLRRWYPYPFMHIGALGGARVLVNAGVMLVAFVALSATFFGLDRWLRSVEPRAIG